MIIGINHMTVHVLDQDKALDVYVNKLGFTLDTDFTMDNGFRWLTVTAPQQPDLEIVLMKPGPPMFDEDQAEAITNLLEANAMGGGVMGTGDCHETYNELTSRGIEFTKSPTQESYGIEALFLDGCGNWYSLSQKDSAR